MNCSVVTVFVHNNRNNFVQQNVWFAVTMFQYAGNHTLSENLVY